MSAGDGITGLDVSKWQASTPPLAGHEFLFARATIGTAKDERYDQHIAAARQAGLIVGAYHFNWRSLSVTAQVRAFLAAAGDVDLYALDVEGEQAFSQDQAEAFIRAVRATGRTIGLYHSLHGFFNAGQDFDWIAYWSDEPPTRAWDFWQFGSINGIDGNRWGGTLAELRSLAGREDPMSIYTRTAATGRLIIRAGRTVRGWRPTATGWEVAKTWPADPEDSSAPYRASLARLSGTTQPSSLLEVSDGTFAGLYVSTAEVDEIADPPNTVDCTDLVEAAVTADRLRARITYD